MLDKVAYVGDTTEHAVPRDQRIAWGAVLKSFGGEVRPVPIADIYRKIDQLKRTQNKIAISPDPITRYLSNGAYIEIREDIGENGPRLPIILVAKEGMPKNLDEL